MILFIILYLIYSIFISKPKKNLYVYYFSLSLITCLIHAQIDNYFHVKNPYFLDIEIVKQSDSTRDNGHRFNLQIIHHHLWNQAFHVASLTGGLHICYAW